MEIIFALCVPLLILVAKTHSIPSLKSVQQSPATNPLTRSSTFPASNTVEQVLTLEQILAQTTANKDLIATSKQEILELLKNLENVLLITRQESIRARSNTEILLGHFFHSSCYDISTEQSKATDASLTPAKKPEKDVVQMTISTILPPNAKPVKVQCENNPSGSGWTVILKRNSGRERFNRTYEEYENGFGTPSTEYYIGNKALHALTTWKKHELMVELEDFARKAAWAQYDTFWVGSQDTNYKLTVSGYNKKSTAGDGMEPHNGMRFTTFDSDRDINAKQNCAIQFGGGGGWWYNNCYQVLGTGEYRNSQGNSYGGISYYPWHNVKHSLKKFRLLIRPLL